MEVYKDSKKCYCTRTTDRRWVTPPAPVCATQKFMWSFELKHDY